ncbi:MAG: fused MFS/spermidine synthase, partial [Gammaproteobacteria bacterium]|nr:fused MFS/spermidine synthase [Gammaproteobacteria bacterium]
MILEIVGARVLAPYLGTSIFVWTSLIGIILASLSLGYWWGGKLADRRPSYRVFALIIFLSGIFVASITFAKEVVLLAIQAAIGDVRLAAAVATLALFAVPSVLLGMVSPYAVKLRVDDLDKSGATVGYLYAISTIGSIIGTFLAGFVLIAYFGNTRILLVLSIALILTSLLANFGTLAKTRMVAIAAVLASLFLAEHVNLTGMAQPAGFVDVDTQYSRVWIFDKTDERSNRPVKLMMIGNENSSAMFLDNDDLVFVYTKYYRLAAHFKPDIKNALLLGGGGYSYPKDFLKRLPEATLDVVEIDPALTALARKHFSLEDHERLKIYHEDGRIFINSAVNKYDAIFVDVFKSLRVLPFQLTTREAVRRIYEILSDDGVVLVNMISGITGGNGQFLRAELATYRALFPHVYLFPVRDPEDGEASQNIVMIALKNPAEPSLVSGDPELDGYLKHLWDKEIQLDLPILTDDFAPVDHYLAAIS